MSFITSKSLVASRRALTMNKARVIYEVQQIILLILGVLIVSVGFVTFQIPHNLNAGGITGISILANNYLNVPIGMLFWFLNLPLLVLGFFHLGRWQFLGKTLFASTLFSISTDTLNYFLPQMIDPFPLTDDLLLNALYVGILGGIGGGMIFKAGGSMGGTGVIGRIIQKRTGKPLSQVYFYTDGIIICTSALLFGWEMPLYGFLMLFLYGIASDYVLEGVSRTRTATIVTDQPEAVIQAISASLNRGASSWEITGGYSGKTHHMIMCTVLRSQVEDLKFTVAQADPLAFVTIGVSHEAMGIGFSPLKQRLS